MALVSENKSRGGIHLIPEDDLKASLATRYPGYPVDLPKEEGIITEFSKPYQAPYDSVVKDIKNTMEAITQLRADIAAFEADDLDHRTRLKNLDTPQQQAARAANLAKHRAELAELMQILAKLYTKASVAGQELAKSITIIRAWCSAYRAKFKEDAEQLLREAEYAMRIDKTLAMGDAILAGLVTYHAVANGPKILAALAQGITAGLYGTASAVGKVVPGG